MSRADCDSTAELACFTDFIHSQAVPLRRINPICPGPQPTWVVIGPELGLPYIGPVANSPHGAGESLH